MKRRSFNPREEALAFRIWQISEQVDWMLSLPQLTAVLGEDEGELRSVCRKKGWLARLAQASRSDLAA
ncbi:hypothetical protein [Roseivivax sp. THAF197b]|uniref:hypothetical protein n=1 Tax=Roseivivax sp. THAF197b TaxID=2588299 RepID=UPI0012689C97|nr:hypothetical protein [Roseivivax sp. THAF197b]QFS84001.1 hypothetical protein FIV09_14285 [Roseivivax sp. THAF197b]